MGDPFNRRIAVVFFCLLSLLTKVSTNTLKINVGLLNHKYCKVAAGYCKKIANCLNNYYRD